MAAMETIENNIGKIKQIIKVTKKAYEEE